MATIAYVQLHENMFALYFVADRENLIHHRLITQKITSHGGKPTKQEKKGEKSSKIKVLNSQIRRPNAFR